MSKWEQIAKHWHMMAATVKGQWDKLTDADLSFIGGKQDLLVMKLQERYGLHQDDAAHQAFQWATNLPDSAITHSLSLASDRPTTEPGHALPPMLASAPTPATLAPPALVK